MLLNYGKEDCAPLKRVKGSWNLLEVLETDLAVIDAPLGEERGSKQISKCCSSIGKIRKISSNYVGLDPTSQVNFKTQRSECQWGNQKIFFAEKNNSKFYYSTPCDHAINSSKNHLLFHSFWNFHVIYF